VENTKDHLLIRMTQLSPTEKMPDYFVHIGVDLKTKQMSEIEVNPAGLYYADIAEEVVILSLYLSTLLCFFCFSLLDSSLACSFVLRRTS
jgi:hypothetical protein